MLWGFLHPLLWIQSPGLEYLCPLISTSCLLSLPCSASKLLMTWLSEPAVQVLGASVLLRPFWFLFLVVSHCSVTSNSVQFSSVTQSCLTLCYPMNQWTSACQASLSITNCRSQHKPMSIESVMPSNHLILCCPLSSCPQSFPASGSFPISQLFASGGPSIGVSASASVLPMNIQDWFPLGWTGWISLQSKGLSRVFSNTTVQKHQSFKAQLSSQSNSHIHTWLLGKP